MIWQGKEVVAVCPGALKCDRCNNAGTIETLDETECLRLITPGGIGRIAYSSRFGPAVLPVNYKVHDGAILFRTAAHSPLDEDLRTGIADAEYRVAFEVDDIDQAERQG